MKEMSEPLFSKRLPVCLRDGLGPGEVLEPDGQRLGLRRRDPTGGDAHRECEQRRP